MKLCSSNIKKFLIFSQKKIFLYIRKEHLAHFTPSSHNEKIHPKKISYTSRNRDPENFVIFSQKKAVLIFQKTENPKKFFIFWTVTCKAWKSKKFYTFSYKEAKFSKLC